MDDCILINRKTKRLLYMNMKKDRIMEGISAEAIFNRKSSGTYINRYSYETK